MVLWFHPFRESFPFRDIGKGGTCMQVAYTVLFCMFEIFLKREILLCEMCIVNIVPSPTWPVCQTQGRIFWTLMMMVNTHGFPTGPGLNPSQAGPPSNITTASGVECYDQLHRPDQETEAQRGEGICLKSHSKEVAELGSEPRSDSTQWSSASHIAWRAYQKLSAGICNKWTDPFSHLAEWQHIKNFQNGTQINCRPQEELLPSQWKSFRW